MLGEQCTQHESLEKSCGNKRVGEGKHAYVLAPCLRC